jgi:MoxR-like ATPase
MPTKSETMQPGDHFTVRSGEFKGQTATIVDAVPFPDTDLQRRRKITVSINGEQVYMLPRMLETKQLTPEQDAVLAPVLDLPVAETPRHGEVMVPAPSGDGFVLVPEDITDVNDPRLDPWRPDPVVVERYVNRILPNGMKDTDFLLTFWEQRQNVLLVGDTQSGKTMMVQVLAVLAGAGTASGKPLPVFTLSGSSGVTDFDMFGQPSAFITPDGRERLVNLPGVVDLAAKAGGILYLDELNHMGERTVSSLHSICDHRRNFVNRQRAVRYEHLGTEVFMPEVVQANENLWVISTINPGYKGTSLGEAITNRFVWIPWGYDDNVEKKLIPSAAVRLLALVLREARANKVIKTPIGTAALVRMHEHVLTYGPEMAIWMIKSMFDPTEQAKVDAIITDRSVLMLLQDEEQARKAASTTVDVDVAEEPESQGGMAHSAPHSPLTGGWNVQP